MSREWSYVGEAKALRETREPLSDADIDIAYMADHEALHAVVMLTEPGGFAGTTAEFKAALRKMARAIERAHGIGGDA